MIRIDRSTGPKKVKGLNCQKMVISDTKLNVPVLLSNISDRENTED